MENSDRDQTDNLLKPERAKVWIFTLALAIAVCLGLIIYTLIIHNPAINFLDSSLFKPELVWVGFIGWMLFSINYFLLWISTSIFNNFPNNKRWVSVISITGILSLTLAFILLFQL